MVMYTAHVEVKTWFSGCPTSSLDDVCLSDSRHVFPWHAALVVRTIGPWVLSILLPKPTLARIESK